MSKLYSKSLVAVTEDQRTIKTPKAIPQGFIKLKNKFATARKTKGNKLSPITDIVVYRSRYNPRLIKRLISK